MENNISHLLQCGITQCFITNAEGCLYVVFSVVFEPSKYFDIYLSSCIVELPQWLVDRVVGCPLHAVYARMLQSTQTHALCM